LFFFEASDFLELDFGFILLLSLFRKSGFASGLIYGLLTNLTPQESLQIGIAHGALAMTTPGDTSMVSLAEVKKLASGGNARVER
jgi:hypothetical protein